MFAQLPVDLHRWTRFRAGWRVDLPPRPLMQRYAIEADALAQPPVSGIGRYIQQLALALDAIAPDTDPAFRATLLYRWSSRRHRQLLPRGRHVGRALWHRDRWPPSSWFDALLCTHNRVPSWPGVPCVMTVYDLYAELGLGPRDAGTLARELETRHRLLQQVSRVICISASTRADLLRHHAVDPAHVHVIHLGVESVFAPAAAEVIDRFRHAHGLDRPFLLFLGLTSPNKNLLRLVQAYRQNADAAGFDLVVVGPAKDVPAELAAVLTLDDGRRRIRRLGYLPDSELPALYSAASALLMPSLYEGFGLPMLEAMRCGTAVLAGDRGASPEVAGGHAVLVDPESVESIAEGIGRVLSVEASARAAARRYTEGKTWRETARQTVAVLRQAAEERA